MCQSEGTHQVVVSFLPPAIGCLLKKANNRRGHRHYRTPLATPLNDYEQYCVMLIVKLWGKVRDILGNSLVLCVSF